MGTAERREREREQLRTRILEAASDILSQQGLDGLSMRGIAERIEYSPATIYLYFRDKEELLRSVVAEGFRRLAETMAAEVEEAGPDVGPREQYAATGRAYAIFALENTAYFRVMFDLPKVAQLECLEPGDAEVPGSGAQAWNPIVALVQRAIDTGVFRLPDAVRGAVIGWGLVHGLTSLFLGGHLRQLVTTRGDFLDLIEEAMESLYEGWRQPAREAVEVAPAGARGGEESGGGPVA